MQDNFDKLNEIINLKDMLNKTTLNHKNKIAYKIKLAEKKYQTYTYEELGEIVNSLGTSLIDMGLKNKRIAIIGENCFEWEISYLAITCGTGIAVPLDKMLPENELKKVLQKSKAEAIFCSGSYVEVLNKIKDKTKIKYIISFDKVNDSNINYQKYLIESGKELLKDGNSKFLEAEIDENKMAIMLFTSGTTSKSKVVALSHQNICINLMDLNNLLNIDENDIFLSVLPLHHVFECTVGFLFPLYKGSQITFSSGLRHIVDDLKEYNVSVMASVPAIYESIFKILIKHLKKEGKLDEVMKDMEEYRELEPLSKKDKFKDIQDFIGNNIKLFISGAASLNQNVEKKFRLLGINIMQAYGLTETSPVVAISTNNKYRLGSVGKVVPSMEAKIVNKNEDGIGELVVKGKNVMLGYFGNKMLTNEAIVDNWFHTGDLAKIDEDGFIFICGRKKNTIVLNNGKNIYPEEIESLVNSIDGVKESFIFGKPVVEGNSDIKLNVKIVYDKKIMKNTYHIEDSDDIYDFLQEEIRKINKNIPRYKMIKGIIITEEPLIKTTTNKLKRQENLLAVIN